MVVSFLQQNPELVAILTVVMLVLVQYQRTLTYSEVVKYTRLKQKLAVLLDSYSRKHLNRPLVREKGRLDFVERVDMTPREFVKRVSPPFEPNLTSNVKYRVRDDVREKEFVHSQWAYIYEKDGERKQTHLYLYAKGDTVDVFVHVETPVTSPIGHLENPQEHGDADGKYRGVIEG